MPLIIPPAPQQSIDVLRAAIPMLAHKPALLRVAPMLSAALTGSPAAAPVSPSFSYRVFTLGLSDLGAATGNNLTAAALSSWRHILSSGEESVTADVSVDGNGANPKFASISSNPWALGVQSEITALSKNPDIAAGSYEASLLQIPALAVRAVWLRDPSGKAADILVPVAPVRSGLVAGRRYSVAEFVSALQDSAAKILADDDPRKGS